MNPRSKTYQLLEAAEALIASPNGWVKGRSVVRSFVSGVPDSYCAIGAIRSAQRTLGFSMNVEHLAESALKRELNGAHFGSIVRFNDAKSTRKKDVVSIFRRARGAES